MWKRKLLLGALAAASIGVLPLPSLADTGIFVDVAPPAPRYEVVPAARPGYTWIPGYWDWRGHRHVWVKGRFEREHRGMYWHPNRWVQHDGRWSLEHGRWDRERFVENERHEMRDRDHDGVPNRFDNAPNNPNRR
jgi:hypothetical protein